jgi:uncharacterized protein (TIGR00251 family)
MPNKMLIAVNVTTEARKESVDIINPTRYEISVKEPALRHSANDRVIRILSGMFPKRSVRLIKGHHSPHKIVDIGEV